MQVEHPQFGIPGGASGIGPGAASPRATCNSGASWVMGAGPLAWRGKLDIPVMGESE